MTTEVEEIMAGLSEAERVNTLHGKCGLPRTNGYWLAIAYVQPTSAIVYEPMA